MRSLNHCGGGIMAERPLRRRTPPRGDVTAVKIGMTAVLRCAALPGIVVRTNASS